MFGADPIHRQFILDDDFVGVGPNDFTYRGPTLVKYSSSEVLFDPVNENRAIISQVGASVLQIWDLSIMQPVDSLSLPTGLTWTGKGEFAVPRARHLVVLVNDGNTKGVVDFYLPLASAEVSWMLYQ